MRGWKRGGMREVGKMEEQERQGDERSIKGREKG